MDARETAACLRPVADQYRRITEPHTGDTTLPAAQQILPIAGEIAVLAGCILNTAGDPHGTGRANLEAMRALAVQLAEVTDRALKEEPPAPTP